MTLLPVTELQESDIDSLIAIVFAHKRGKDPDYPEDAKRILRMAFFQTLSRAHSQIFVCHDANQNSIGYINFHLVMSPMIGGPELYITDLLVKEGMRGQGIGESLLSEAEEYARDHKCDRMMLLNNRETEGYRRDFYKKHGFTERENWANFVKIVGPPPK
jgi:ribosomal protein S18 acetylase RimI-like enzyme